VDSLAAVRLQNLGVLAWCTGPLSATVPVEIPQTFVPPGSSKIIHPIPKDQQYSRDTIVLLLFGTIPARLFSDRKEPDKLPAGMMMTLTT
jgi:hypothetical protein